MAIFSTPTTYRIGLMHTKLNRLLKQRTTRSLEGTGINPPEWALLGVLYDEKKAIRLSDVADELGVEASFVTTMVKSLTKRDLVTLQIDPDDNRAKEITLTSVGKAFVDRTEKHLRDAMRPLVGKTSIRNLITYFSVLNALVDVAEAIERKDQEQQASASRK